MTSTKMTSTKMMELDSLSVVAIDLNDVPESQRFGPYKNDLVAFLLHGFGASANDLVGLAPSIGIARRWFFPHAPVPITIAGMSYGRAWFPDDPEELEQALYGTYFQRLRELTPSGLSAAADAVRGAIDASGVPWSRVILGGFSQGAIVTAEILRRGAFDRSAPLPAAALLFSGALIADAWWDAAAVRDTGAARDAAEMRDAAAVRDDAAAPEKLDSDDRPKRRSDLPLNVPVFQSHGTEDTILPIEEGRALTARLAERGYPVTTVEFHDGHTIPAVAVDEARQFLAEQTSSL